MYMHMKYRLTSRLIKTINCLNPMMEKDLSIEVGDYTS